MRINWQNDRAKGNQIVVLLMVGIFTPREALKVMWLLPSVIVIVSVMIMAMDVTRRVASLVVTLWGFP